MPWRITGSTTSTTIPGTMRPGQVSERTCASARSSLLQSITSQAGSRDPRRSKQPGPPLVCHSHLTRPPAHLADRVHAMPDTYSNEELRRCSLWALTEFTGRQHIFIGLRDRAMLLMSAATALRGENCRMLQWSDLFRTVVPLDQTTRVEVREVLQAGCHPRS